MIYLFTGAPGAGKTLNAIKFVLDHSKKNGVFADRPVIAVNIRGLNIDGWTQIDQDQAVKWHEYPAGTIFLIDECQEVFPLRSSGAKVPQHVSQLAKHRHDGFDFILTCQFPRQIDVNVRNIVNEHRHLSRKFGTKQVTQHKWGRVEENPTKSKAGSQQSNISLDKSIFDKYESAELHTVKRSIPWQIYALPVLVALLGYTGYTIKSKYATVNEPTPKTVNNTISPNNKFTPAGDGPPQFSLTQLLTPAIENFPQSAPIYQDLHKAVSMPRPQCIVNFSSDKIDCRCYSHQATRMAINLQACMYYIKNGYDYDYRLKDSIYEDNQGEEGGAAVASADGAPFAPIVQPKPMGITFDRNYDKPFQLGQN